MPCEPIKLNAKFVRFCHPRTSKSRHKIKMTYEEYLDEVTTLLTEMFDLSDKAAIKYVMRAQAADFFTLHDDHPEMRTPERAQQDAKSVYEQRNISRPEIFKK